MTAGIAIIEGGAAMAYNSRNDAPWWGGGTPLNDAVTADEMLVAAKQNWEVIPVPLKRQKLDSDGYVEVTDAVALVRSIDDHHIATVSDTYTIIQNREMYDFAEVLMGFGVRFETAGVLNDGRLVWAQAVLEGRTLNIPGDHSVVKPYMVLSTGHDALRSFTVHNTPIRVVCQNTLDAAVKDGKRVVTIRHTKNSPQRIAEAKAAMKNADNYFDAFEKVASDLVARPLTLKDVEKFLVRLIPGSPTAENAYKSERQRADIASLLAHSENLDGLALTGWKVYQAVAEWADYDRVYRPTKLGSADDARAMGMLNGGTSQKIKDKALALLTPSTNRGSGGRFAKASAN